MREANESNPFTITEVRCVHFRVPKRVHRQNHMCALSRKRLCFEVHSSRVRTISEVFEQLLLDRRVGQSKDLIELLFLSQVGKVKLRFSKRGALLGQHLSRQVSRPVVPLT